MIDMYMLDRAWWPPHLHPPHPDWEESLLAAWFGIRKGKCWETLLLEDSLRENYCQAMHGLDWLQFPGAHRIRPRRIRETLQGKGILRPDANSGASTLPSTVRLPPLPSELEALLPLILAAADNLERVQGDALERAELTKLAVTKDGLDKELGVLMVA